MTRDFTLSVLRALARASAPLSTADLARRAYGRRSPGNAAYLVLRELARLGVVERCEPVVATARGAGRPVWFWRLSAICARGVSGADLPSLKQRSAA